jgi:16S rRNA pseudouridine516 synthase
MPRRREHGLAVKAISAEEIIFSQGIGTRRECRDLLRREDAFISWPGSLERPLRWDEQANPIGATLRIGTLSLPWLAELRLILHKPVDYECSHKPSHHASIFDLFPPPFLRRGLEAAGRLDADTTGLLLLSTDGKWLHDLTSPRRRVPKVYRVTHDLELSDSAAETLRQGVMIYADQGRPGGMERTQPAEVEKIEARVTRLTITEGKYHQVKRMFAALGLKVMALHRECVGAYALPEDLLPGQWRPVN